VAQRAQISLPNTLVTDQVSGGQRKVPPLPARLIASERDEGGVTGTARPLPPNKTPAWVQQHAAREGWLTRQGLVYRIRASGDVSRFWSYAGSIDRPGPAALQVDPIGCWAIQPGFQRRAVGGADHQGTLHNRPRRWPCDPQTGRPRKRFKQASREWRRARQGSAPRPTTAARLAGSTRIWALNIITHSSLVRLPNAGVPLSRHAIGIK